MIKLLKIAFIVLAVTATTQAQITKGDTLTMSVSFPELDMYRLLNFQDINYYKIKITGKNLKDKKYYMVSKEFTDGKLSKTDTLFNTAKQTYIRAMESDTLSFFIMSQQNIEKDIKLQLGFDGYSNIKKFKNLSTSDYELMNVGSLFTMQIGKPFYAFAYIQPYINGSTQYYCAPAKSGKDIEKWGKEFNIPHYILFEMNFFE